MKHIVFVILFSVVAFGQSLPTYDFEEAGTPTGWTVSVGTPDFDYATAPAPLAGSQSLIMDGSTGTKQVYVDLGGAFDETFAAFILRRQGAAPAGQGYFCIFNSGTTLLAYVSLNATTAAVRAGHGATDVISSRIISVDTTYYFWVRYKKATAGDGILEVYVSTDGSKPTTPIINITNGANTSSTNRSYKTASSSFARQFILDDVIHSATMPGNFDLGLAATDTKPGWQGFKRTSGWKTF